MTFAAWHASHYPEQRLVAWLAFLLDVIAAASLLGLMLLTCADVLGRYFLDNAIDGTTEITELGIALMVFAQLPIVTWRNSHVVVDILDDWLGSSVVSVLAVLAQMLMAAALYCIALRIFALAARSMRRGEVTEYLHIPLGLVVEYIAWMSWLTAAMLIGYTSWQLFSRFRG